MNKRLNRISLTDLYKSQSVRDIVWRCLCPEFEAQFEKLMKRGDAVKSSLVKKANNKKFWIKELH